MTKANNPYKPIVLIGDSHGGVNSFKLSNNLAKMEFEELTTKEEKEEWLEKEKDLMDECLLLGSMFDREEEQPSN